MAVRSGVQLGVSVARSLSANELDSREGYIALVMEVQLRIPRGELDVPPSHPSSHPSSSSLPLGFTWNTVVGSPPSRLTERAHTLPRRTHRTAGRSPPFAAILKANSRHPGSRLNQYLSPVSSLNPYPSPVSSINPYTSPFQA